MRKIGLDWGEARIGVAVSDPLDITAQPLYSIRNNKDAVDKLKRLIEQYGADEIVLGLPKQMDGIEGIAASKVRRFYQQIKDAVPVKITLWDERLTTKIAGRAFADAGTSVRSRKNNIDAAAAGIMLQSFMDSNRK